MIAPAPGRLSTVLLGLCLLGGVSCEAKDDGDAKQGEKKEAQPAAAEAKVEPPPTPPAEAPPAEAPPAELAGDTAIEETTAAPTVRETGSEGTDTGASVDDAPPPSTKKDPQQKTKYGGPRPMKKYGAPPPM